MECIEIQTVVVGAGVVGLAVARELAKTGHDVVVLEKESSFGTQTSSRNSEVIHAGLYYPKGSLKAQLCVQGRKMLYRYCDEKSVDHRKCGKLVVATDDEQRNKLEGIYQHAVANGCENVSILDKSAVLEKESEVNAVAALYSPETGIVDSHGLMVQLIADLEHYGGQCVFNSEVNLVKAQDGSIELSLNDGEAKIVAKNVVNSCGLDAPDWIKPIGSTLITWPKAYYAKGSYFSYSGKVPFDHLIYPVPVPGGLGTHLTLDLQGQAKFGPDVEWLSGLKPSESDYIVDELKRDTFYDAVVGYWPGIVREKLIPDYSGMRPKISPQGAPAADFTILGPKDHGVQGLVCLFGIESPGLTSSLAIAAYVDALL